MPSVFTLEGTRKKRMSKKAKKPSGGLSGASPPQKGTKRCLWNPHTKRGHLQIFTGSKRLPWKFIKGECTPDNK